jgi:hypothetical protein
MFFVASRKIFHTCLQRLLFRAIAVVQLITDRHDRHEFSPWLTQKIQYCIFHENQDTEPQQNSESP